MNRTCHVTTANTPRLLYAFKLALMENMKANGTSRSTILKSEETRLSTLPRGVESKNDIGARNNELSNWENKDLDVCTPRTTTANDLDSKKNIVQTPIAMYTEINLSVLTSGFWTLAAIHEFCDICPDMKIM
uniref:Uncharacterized protein n=1 Tax=Arundo donax TaxID=35708 RepID=A0A0A9HNK2_ARUDO